MVWLLVSQGGLDTWVTWESFNVKGAQLGALWVSAVMCQGRLCEFSGGMVESRSESGLGHLRGHSGIQEGQLLLLF